MLIPQDAQCEAGSQHGGRRDTLAELRSRLECPSQLDDGQRQRLQELARRLRRIQALGESFAGIELSPFAAAALGASGSAVAMAV